MMELNNLIWPQKYMGLTIRNMFIGLVVTLWATSIYYHFSYLNTVSALHLVAMYLIFLIWCFLNNRTMPIGATYSASHSNSGDVVSEFIGGNIGDYINLEDSQSSPEQRPIYDPERLKAISGATDLAPHSDYDCKFNCGYKP